MSPKDFQIFPNPFSNETVLSFNHLFSDKFNIEIRDIEGRFITNLLPKNLNIEKVELLWDGTNNVGRKVNDGMYFITHVSGNINETRKVLLMKN